MSQIYIRPKTATWTSGTCCQLRINLIANEPCDLSTRKAGDSSTARIVKSQRGSVGTLFSSDGRSTKNSS